MCFPDVFLPINTRPLLSPEPTTELRNFETSSDSKNMSSGDSEKNVSMGSKRLSIIPKWSKIARWDHVELAVFYTAYQLIECDWERIASFLPGRTVDMVKMLYDNNTQFLNISSSERNLISFSAIVDMFQDKFVYANDDSGASEDSHNDDSENDVEVSEADGAVKGKYEDAGKGLTEVYNSDLENKTNVGCCEKVCLVDFDKEGTVERENVLVSVSLGDEVFWQKRFVSVSFKVCESDSETEGDHVKVGFSVCGRVFGDSDSYKAADSEV